MTNTMKPFIAGLILGTLLGAALTLGWNALLASRADQPSLVQALDYAGHEVECHITVSATGIRHRALCVIDHDRLRIMLTHDDAPVTYIHFDVQVDRNCFRSQGPIEWPWNHLDSGVCVTLVDAFPMSMD
jgi:hypothetical protein